LHTNFFILLQQNGHNILKNVKLQIEVKQLYFLLQINLQQKITNDFNKNKNYYNKKFICANKNMVKKQLFS
jgi:hypothetical protein